MMTTRNARNVELALCNDSDCSERTSSDRTLSDDMAIVNRLQYLTQRVEDLERKLEKRMPIQSDNLSFALSVDNNNSVPNVDIKVLSGPREPYCDSTEDDLMCGWDDGIVERNTSFLIIPVGDDKDLQLNEPQRLKQTLDGTLEPIASLPALCCADPHNEMMDSADEHEVALQVNKPHATPFSTHRAISVARNFTNQSHALESEHTDSDVIPKLSGSDEQKEDNERLEEIEQSHHQDRDRMDTSISHDETPQLDGTLRYGYTISVTGVSPRRTKPLPSQPSVFHFQKNNEKDIPLERRASDNTVINQDFASDEENKSTIPRYVVRSSVLATSENVCYTDANQRNDNVSDRLNGHGDIDDDDPSLSKHHGLHQYFVKSHTCHSHSIEKQLKNAESRINGPKGKEIEHGSTKGKMSLFDDVSVENEVEEITSRLDRTMGTGSDEDKHILMQIEAKDRLWRCKELCCPGNGSDDPCVLSGLVNNNTWHNTSSLKEITLDCSTVNDLENNTLHKNTRPRCASNKTAPRKVRVRSLELPLTSSEEDLSLTMLGDPGLAINPRTTRPQRKKQRNRAAKCSFAARNNMTCHEPIQNLEQQLKELIDPGEIGDLQEELAAVNRQLLLAIMSPTDSGYIGSNTDSPRDVWKDHYYETPHINDPSTPVSMQSQVQTPSYPSTLYSSPKGRVDPVPGSTLHSVASHSSGSSTVSYVGGTDYSELSYGEDRKVPSLRLQEYFPGPSRIPFDNHTSTVRLNEYLLNRHPIASPTSSVGTSDLSDSFFGSESDYCECQTGIATEHDFREELKSISRYVLEAGEKTGVMKKASKPLKKYHLDEEQGEMDIFGARLQKGEHKAVPILVKVILRLRKHFFGGIEGPNSLKSLSPRKERSFVPGSRARKISFSPSAMLLSAVGERSAAEIRDVIEKDRVDVNQLSPSGKSLLHKAAASGDLESIHTLMQYGAKVNLTDQDGFAPVHSALRRCHYKCAIFLVECGTDMAAYTRARIHELTMIKNMSSEYMRSVLNTPL